jgi:ABC-type nickel/cobalt efflux system permease component RcnA
VTRLVKVGGLALGLVGLLLLVAIAARGGHPSTTGRIATRAVPNTLQDSLVTFIAITYVAVIVAIVIAVVRYRSNWQDPKSNWLTNFALVTVLMLIATGIGYYAMTHTNLRQQAQKTERAQTARGNTNRVRHLKPTPVPVREANFQWPVVFGIGGLVLLAGVWIYIRNRRSLVPDRDDQSLEADMVSAIETTIDDLRSERDPRKAVIAAYAQMERTLTAHGLPRDQAEAPREYLTRLLRGLAVRETAVHTLTELFEYAKFSRHEIDAAMKESAIDALLAVREDLQREEALAA